MALAASLGLPAAVPGWQRRKTGRIQAGKAGSSGWSMAPEPPAGMSIVTGRTTMAAS